MSIKSLLGAGIGIILILTFSFTPSYAQTSLELIESNHPAVVQAGTWTDQTTPNASGGGYLYSGGSPADVLTLAFTGTTIEIVYVADPNTGTMVIEVDNTVLRTVITTSETTAFYQTTTIDYLEDQDHLLKIYGSNGVIALDAFYTQLPVDESSAEADGIVTGRVIDANSGLPIPDLNVSAEFLSGGFVSTCTDSNGDYALTVPLDTEFRAGAAMGPGNPCGGEVEYVEEYWQEAPGRNTAITLTLTAGNPTLNNINFTLELGGTVTGRVVDEVSGLPIENMAARADFDGYGIAVCTDANGDYVLEGLAFNTPIRMRSGGGSNFCGGPENYVEEYWENTPNYNAATIITLTPANPDRANINFTLVEGGTVSGQVTDQSTGLPIVNINVNVNLGDYGRGGCTDENGEYTISGIPYNTNFRVEAASGNNWCGGPQNYLQEYWEEVSDYNQAMVLQVTSANPDQTDIDFTLEQGGTVIGHVVNQATGQPIANMHVNADFDGFGRGTCTDANGDYTLTGLPLNRPFKVMAAGGNSNTCGGPETFAKEYWQETANRNQAVQLELTSGTLTITGINFTLQAGGTVRGRVTDQNTGLPIPNMNVNVEYNGWGEGTCTDANGYYKLTGIPLNMDFRVNAPVGGFNWCGGSDDYVQEYWQEKPNYDTANILKATPATPNITNINLTLVIGGTVSGQVIDEATSQPLVNIVVGLGFDGYGKGVCTDENGQYLIKGVPYNTEFTVNAGGSNNWCGGSNTYVEEYWDNQISYNNAVRMTVSVANPHKPNINFALAEGGSISGQVTDQTTGLPIANMGVSADFEGFGRGTCTDANGDYTLTGLPKNMDFRVRAGGNHWCGGPQNLAQEYWEETPDYQAATILQVTNGSLHLTGIHFTLEVGGTVSGRIVDQTTGQPLANMNVGAGFESWWGIGTCTDANGNYTIAGIPLNLVFRVDAGGWYNDCGGSRDYAHEFYDNTPSWPDAVPITLTSLNPNKTNVNFALELGGKIRGKITDQATGLPIANAHVEVNTEVDGQWSDGFTDANGNYEITALWSGQYTVNATADGYAREYYNGANGTYFYEDQVRVVVTSGSLKTNINIPLELGGSISGQITDEANGLPIANMLVRASGVADSCTDADGNYTLAFLPLNMALTVMAGDGNYCQPNGSRDYIPEWYDGVSSEAQATELTLTTGQPTITNINIALNIGGMITGTITAAENGMPVANVWVCAIDYEAVAFNQSSYWWCEPSDQNGVYTIRGVSGGQKRLRAWADNRVRLFYSNSSTFEGATAVNVTVGATTPNINFVLPLAGYIEGTVYAMDGVTPLLDVTISTEDGKYVTCTDHTGKYKMQVPPGTYKIKAETGICSHEFEFPTQYYNRVTSPSAATPITVNAVGQSKVGINFVQGIDVTLLAPLNGIITRTPTFVWTEVAGAQWAHLRITLTNGTAVLDAWYPFGTGGVQCMAGECWYTLTTEIGNSIGNTPLKWSLQLWGPPFGTSYWIGPEMMTITAPTMTSPTGTITDPMGNPTYGWNKLDEAAWYQLMVTGPSGFSFTQWFEASAVCPSSACSTTATTKLPSKGNYNAYVQAWSPSGYSPWSLVRSFAITATPPSAIVKTSPVGSNVTTGAVTFQWDKNPNASRYALYVMGPSGFVDYRQWAADTYCGGLACAVTIEVPANGAYQWYIAGVNVAGYGNWGSPAAFTVAVANVGAITKLTPVHNAGLSSGIVEFTWQHDPKAVSYQLYVGGPSFSNFRQWDAAIYCSGGTCGVTLVLPSNGNYFWYLNGVNAVGVQGPWSAGGAADNWGRRDFVVNAGTVTQVVPKVAPLTSQTTLVVDFAWQTVTNATSYWLYVSGPSGYVHNKKYTVGVDVTCSPTCGVSLVLPNKGSYTWYIEGISAAGGGPWGSGQAFMLNPTAPIAQPIHLAPPDMAVIGALGPIEFEWESADNATWYNLVLVNAQTGVVVGNYWYSASAVGCELGETCHITQAVAKGNYRWTVFTWGPGSTVVHSYQHGVTLTRRFIKLS